MGASSPAPQGGGAVRTIEVVGLRKPASWAYRDFLEGLDTFEDERQLAPAGVLSFILRPEGPLSEATVVSLEGETDSHELPRNGLCFQIPRLKRFDRSDVRLTVSVRGKAFGQDLGAQREKMPRMLHKLIEIGNPPIAEVRTPGLPENVYRLGDVRLGCKVSVTIFKEQAPWWLSTMVTTGTGTRDWCTKAGGGTMVSQPVDRPYIALTLRDGGREQRLTFDEPQTILQIPPNPERWSDETLMTVEWAPESAGVTAPGMGGRGQGARTLRFGDTPAQGPNRSSPASAPAPATRP